MAEQVLLEGGREGGRDAPTTFRRRTPWDGLEAMLRPPAPGSDGRRPPLCMQGGRRGAAGERGGASPNLINALIVFRALEDKNGISQSLRHGTEIKPLVTFKSNREPRSLIIPHRGREKSRV